MDSFRELTGLIFFQQERSLLNRNGVEGGPQTKAVAVTVAATGSAVDNYRITTGNGTTHISDPLFLR